MQEPNLAFVFHDRERPLACQQVPGGFAGGGVGVRLDHARGPLGIHVRSLTGTSVSRVILRWSNTFTPATLFLGDAWERGYGDLQWRHMQPERFFPWYFAAHDPDVHSTRVFGVTTQPGAMCYWMVDPRGILLSLDLRNGSGPVELGGRELLAARVIRDASNAGESPMALLTRFCRRMCEKPRLPRGPVVGNNNWYYAYGENFDHHVVLRDAAFIADLAGTHAVRPFCVIDAGWRPGTNCHGGPWTEGMAGKFPDMPGLAREIKAMGVRPGIWIRPSALTTVDKPERLLEAPGRTGHERPLDLTLPENLETARADMARMRGWGYELIKHDFSTWDAFGRWGFELGAELTNGPWQWRDTSLTNAEVLLQWYKTLRDGAGDALLIGCNTVGHLGAGLFEIQRTGDDTSGKSWERTRKYGVNTLAFRMPQHNTFFCADADCCPHTALTPWEKDRQWLDLVARSGTALFFSADPSALTAEKKRTFGEAVQTALSGGEEGGAEPLDWMYSTCPESWRVGERTVRYDWHVPTGAC